jgi:hypothetical protein
MLIVKTFGKNINKTGTFFFLIVPWEVKMEIDEAANIASSLLPNKI